MPLHYVPPSPQNLRDLKQQLGYSGRQMADLFGLASAQQWHKYCGGSEPREMSLPMLFLAGALLHPDGTVTDVFTWCRAVGATVEITESVSRQAPDGEPQP
jgi:transcriptional regulator with XRE-family HTH domain